MSKKRNQSNKQMPNKSLPISVQLMVSRSFLICLDTGSNENTDVDIFDIYVSVPKLE